MDMNQPKYGTLREIYPELKKLEQIKKDIRALLVQLGQDEENK